MVEPINIQKTEDLQSYILTFRCPMCGQEHTLKITSEELFLINNGVRISLALASHSEFERDQFITGLCRECWDSLYDFDDEDETKEDTNVDKDAK